MPVIGLRTDFRLCAGSDGGLVNTMIQGSVLSMCRSEDEVLGVLGTLGRGNWHALTPKTASYSIESRD